MKKIILSVLIFVLVPFQALATISERTQRIVDFYTQQAENIIEKKGTSYKQVILLALNEKLDTLSMGTIKYEAYEKLIINVTAIGINQAASEYYEENKIDIKTLKASWLKWHNDVRKKLLLQNYQYNDLLDTTAFEWSYVSTNKATMDHKRSTGDSYYDYGKITSWFEDRGVVCRNDGGTTNSESIGWGNLYCSDNDCTEEVSNVMKQIFDMYMGEKGKGYPTDAHYRAIISNKINYMGLGVALKKRTDKPNYYTMYLTTHYCTHLIN